MTPEHETLLKHWLETEDLPHSFYDLLGLPLLTADQQQLSARIESAAEFLYGYQNNHKSKPIRERATVFGKQLAEARRLLRNTARLQDFERELVQRLWEETWDRFLEQFDQSRHDDVTKFCEGEHHSPHRASTQESVPDAWRTLQSPNSLLSPFDAPTARAAQEAWATFTDLPVVWENSIGMKMVVIPPGQFRMGSHAEEQGHYENERQTEVALSGHFSIGQFAVTQRDWREVMNSTPWEGRDFVKRAEDVPATYMSWEEARFFCRLLTKRDQQQGLLPNTWEYDLPTEAQWEYACRAGSTTRFSFGDDDQQLPDQAWFDDNAWDAGEGHPLPVGQKPANAFGLFDMHGNVWEWCRDWYHPFLTGGTDPEALEATALRVTRGGSWGHASGMCRSAYRLGKEPETKNSTQGFRVIAVPVA